MCNALYNNSRIQYRERGDVWMGGGGLSIYFWWHMREKEFDSKPPTTCTITERGRGDGE